MKLHRFSKNFRETNILPYNWLYQMNDGPQKYWIQNSVNLIDTQDIPYLTDSFMWNFTPNSCTCKKNSWTLCIQQLDILIRYHIHPNDLRARNVNNRKRHLNSVCSRNRRARISHSQLSARQWINASFRTTTNKMRLKDVVDKAQKCGAWA